MFGLVFLFPVFYSGSPNKTIALDLHLVSKNSLDTFTVLNVTAKNPKIVYLYFVAMLIIPMAVGYGIY